MDICKMLTISTAHIKQETAAILDKSYSGPIPGWLYAIGLYDKDEYGWFIMDWDYRSVNTFPADLLECIKVAEKHGCTWLCLDCDGEVLSSIPTYDWNE